MTLPTQKYTLQIHNNQYILPNLSILAGLSQTALCAMFGGSEQMHKPVVSQMLNLAASCYALQHAARPSGILLHIARCRYAFQMYNLFTAASCYV